MKINDNLQGGMSMYCFEWKNVRGQRMSGTIAAKSPEEAAARLKALKETAVLTGSKAADPLP